MTWDMSHITVLLLEQLTFLTFDALLGWNNSLILVCAYYSQNNSGITGTGLTDISITLCIAK